MAAAGQTLWCDGADNKKTEGAAWASVVYDDKQDAVQPHRQWFGDLTLIDVQLPVGNRTIAVAQFNDVKQQNINGAELMAMVMALRIASHRTDVNVICSDSQVIVESWSRGKVGPLTAQAMDPRKMQLIQECVTLRLAFEKRGGRIVRVSGKENKADLGWHKDKATKITRDKQADLSVNGHRPTTSDDAMHFHPPTLSSTTGTTSVAWSVPNVTTTTPSPSMFAGASSLYQGTLTSSSSSSSALLRTGKWTSKMPRSLPTT